MQVFKLPRATKNEGKKSNNGNCDLTTKYAYEINLIREKQKGKAKNETY